MILLLEGLFATCVLNVVVTLVCMLLCMLGCRFVVFFWGFKCDLAVGVDFLGFCFVGVGFVWLCFLGVYVCMFVWMDVCCLL